MTAFPCRASDEARQGGCARHRNAAKGYNDETVRNAYNEVLATDYGGKRVKRSKYSEIK